MAALARFLRSNVNVFYVFNSAFRIERVVSCFSPFRCVFPSQKGILAHIIGRIT